jgi:hypothetical protein
VCVCVCVNKSEPGRGGWEDRERVRGREGGRGWGGGRECV